MLHEKIKKEIKQAMLDKNQVKLAVVRGLASAFTNEVVAKGRKPDEWLTDEETLAVIKRATKQRRDSIAQFKAGDRLDLAESEEAELAYLEAYLPKTLTESEITPIIKAKITALGLTNKSQFGKLMSAIMKELGGQVDGDMVKKIAEQLLT